MVPPWMGNSAGAVMAAGHSRGGGRKATAGGHAAAATCAGAMPRAMARPGSGPTRKRLVRLLVTPFFLVVGSRWSVVSIAYALGLVTRITYWLLATIVSTL